MEKEVPSPPSPRGDDHNGWTLVERPVAAAAAEPLDGSLDRPRASSPNPEPAAEAPAEQEELNDGLKSPASERLADDVLREPFQAGGPLQLQLAAPPPAPTVEEPATPTAASGPYTASCGDLACQHYHDHSPGPHSDNAAAGGSGAGCGAGGWGFERHRERMRAATRLSGEGALEGFQDPQDLLFADSAAPGAAARIGAGALAGGEGSTAGDGDPGGDTVSLGWDALLSSVWGDLVRELEDMRSLVATTAAALWERVQDGRMAVDEWAAAVRASAHQAAKSVGRSGCPLWALIGVSGLAAMALTALAAQLFVNRRLASQLRQRDRDLARLVVKILNLQDALHSAARAVPLLRHTSMERFTTTTTLIGMV